MVGKSVEVTKTSGRRQVDVVALKEVRYKNDRAKKLRVGKFEYKLYQKEKKSDMAMSA